jgi:hypothetical protein
MNNISQLIEKYFQGETTLKEEKQLKIFFQQEDIAPEWKIYQPLFNFLEVEKSRKPGEHFESKVYQKIQPTQKKTRVLHLAPSLDRGCRRLPAPRVEHLVAVP